MMAEDATDPELRSRTEDAGPEETALLDGTEVFRPGDDPMLLPTIVEDVKELDGCLDDKTLRGEVEEFGITEDPGLLKIGAEEAKELAKLDSFPDDTVLRGNADEFGDAEECTLLDGLLLVGIEDNLEDDRTLVSTVLLGIEEIFADECILCARLFWTEVVPALGTEVICAEDRADGKLDPKVYGIDDLCTEEGTLEILMLLETEERFAEDGVLVLRLETEEKGREDGREDGLLDPKVLYPEDNATVEGILVTLALLLTDVFSGTDEGILDPTLLWEDLGVEEGKLELLARLEKEEIFGAEIETLDPTEEIRTVDGMLEGMLVASTLLRIEEIFVAEVGILDPTVLRMDESLEEDTMLVTFAVL